MRKGLENGGFEGLFDGNFMLIKNFKLMSDIHHKPCLGKMIKILIYDLGIFSIQMCIPFIKHDNRTLVIFSNFLNLFDELLSC